PRQFRRVPRGRLTHAARARRSSTESHLEAAVAGHHSGPWSHYEGLSRQASIMRRMSHFVDNHGDADYAAVLSEMAARARAWQGPMVIVAHVDPDGDALGSALALARALRSLGKSVVVPLTPPAFLRFLAEEGELSAPLTELQPETLLF